MSNASKIAVVLFLFVGVGVYFGQQDANRLKKQQQKLEQQIAATRVLLETSASNTSFSLNQLNLINQQIRSREQLLKNYDNQIRTAELKIKEKSNTISDLDNKITTLKEQYRKLLLYAYKKRSKYSKLMYVFSSKSVEEARKRKLYLEKLAEIQKKQLNVIKQNQLLLTTEIKELEEEKVKKQLLLDKKKEERAVILLEKQKQQEIYLKLKTEETRLRNQLLEKVAEKKRIEERIRAAIQAELIAEQKRVEKARKEAEKRRIAAEKAKKNNPATVVEKEEVPAPFLTTKEENLLGKSFQANRGRLPWPVEKGTVTENYGKNPHPTLINVFTNNNGLDISTPKSATVRCVYEGEVTSVLNISGAGKVVIVKHGNYRTVYANLQEVYVTKGSVLSTKSPIGLLLPSKNGEVSVVHFEIHEVTSTGGIERHNPNLWIAR
ncbi:MAG: murein hydrolase activator EnvC family protein [Lishizhenia sp.]